MVYDKAFTRTQSRQGGSLLQPAHQAAKKQCVFVDKVEPPRHSLVPTWYPGICGGLSITHTHTLYTNRHDYIQLVNSEFTPNASDIETALAVLAPTRLLWHQEQAGVIPNSCPNDAATPPGGGGQGDDASVWDSSTWQVNYVHIARSSKHKPV